MLANAEMQIAAAIMATTTCGLEIPSGLEGQPCLRAGRHIRCPADNPGNALRDSIQNLAGCVSCRNTSGTRREYRLRSHSVVLDPGSATADSNLIGRFAGRQLDFGEPRGLVCPSSIHRDARMHLYRTHTCGALRAADSGHAARLSGWVHAKRDHGGLLFIDLRDHYGMTQCVFPAGSPAFAAADAVRPESVITVTGQVVPREAGTVNPRLPTGEVELRAADLIVQSAAEVLPMQVAGDEKFPEDIRLKYRFIDLRREKLHRNIMLRAGVIASLRRRMMAAGFTEFQTPILTADSPEGARAFLVPARLHPGKFYALPQAPQQFKQLIMVAGFDRYFQIAPCFRDEASRADRSPGEFYQLDFEMSFATQEDVFTATEPVIGGVFEEFAEGRAVTPAPWPRIPYDTALMDYGTDKPDLRNPLKITDVTQHFAGSSFGLFARIAASGGVVRAIPAPGAASQPRSFFDKLNDWAKHEGAGERSVPR